jgi:hypothetical protein
MEFMCNGLRLYPHVATFAYVFFGWKQGIYIIARCVFDSMDGAVEILFFLRFLRFLIMDY